MSYLVVQCSPCMGSVEPLLEFFSGNDFDIICSCFSIIIDNDIFIQGMDITGSQFLDLAQIFLEKTQKILKGVQCAPLSPTLSSASTRQ